jgi:hypothetical protein
MNRMSQRFKDDQKGGSQVVINLVGRISHFCNSWSVKWLLRSSREFAFAVWRIVQFDMIILPGYSFSWLL